jgi:hypothetical protein
MGRPISPIGEARLKKERALARMRELQSQALEGKLLSAVEVRATWTAAMSALRDRALGMADRIASRGAGRSTAGRPGWATAQRERIHRLPPERRADYAVRPTEATGMAPGCGSPRPIAVMPMSGGVLLGHVSVETTDTWVQAAAPWRRERPHRAGAVALGVVVSDIPTYRPLRVAAHRDGFSVNRPKPTGK